MRTRQKLVATGLWLALAISATAQANNLVPAFLLQLPSSSPSIFIADAGNAVIYHYVRGDDGSAKLAAQSYLSIGQNGIGKTRAWDRKTPLGIYFVVDQLDTRRLHEKYGITAFPLDYPGPRDRQAGRTGDGIWVHGVLPGGGVRPALDTDGCLALPNEELALLAPHFVPQQTAVIVTREMRWVEPDAVAANADALTAAVDGWLQAHNERDLSALLASYSESFSHRGLNYDEWLSFLLESLPRRAPVTFEATDLLLLHDPEEAGLYLSRFQLKRAAAGRTSVTTKRLYWRLEEDGNLKIVAEDNG